MKFIMHLMI